MFLFPVEYDEHINSTFDSSTDRNISQCGSVNSSNLLFIQSVCVMCLQAIILSGYFIGLKSLGKSPYFFNATR